MPTAVVSPFDPFFTIEARKKKAQQPLGCAFWPANGPSDKYNSRYFTGYIQVYYLTPNQNPTVTLGLPRAPFPLCNSGRSSKSCRDNKSHGDCCAPHVRCHCALMAPQTWWDSAAANRAFQNCVMRLTQKRSRCFFLAVKCL